LIKEIGSFAPRDDLFGLPPVLRRPLSEINGLNRFSSIGVYAARLSKLSSIESLRVIYLAIVLLQAIEDRSCIRAGAYNIIPIHV
jgi:hypothetical protein